MDKLLAKYADYSQIDQPTLADLNNTGSDEAGAGPSRSATEPPGNNITIAALAASTSARRSTPTSEPPHHHHHFAGQVDFAQPPQGDESRHDSSNFPALFRLAQHSSDHARSQLHDESHRSEWQYTSPGEKVSKGDVLADFAGLSSSDVTYYYNNRPSASAGASASASSSQGAENPTSEWVASLLVECARAIAVSDSARVKNLMWVLNEMGSPYGDSDQRLAAYFLQALFCRITGTGSRCHRILTAAAEKTYSFDSLRKMILDYQEASPWTTFGHVAGNAAMMEAFEGEMKIHIVDISSTYCTQWPTLLEALATRADGTPHLRLSTIVISPEETALKVMKQIMTRLERFARLMGVPFEYSVTHQPELEKLDPAALELRQDEILAITCNNTLHHVPEIVATQESRAEQTLSPRDTLLCTFRNVNPKIMVLVEDEMELVSADFMTNFCEALRFYSLLFESMEENFPRTSNERLMLERICARNLVNLIACDPPENIERQEKGIQWDYRLRRLGLLPSPFSDDAVDDVRALLKRYKEGWGLSINDNRLYLTWKEQVVLCATAWKPIVNPSPES